MRLTKKGGMINERISKGEKIKITNPFNNIHHLRRGFLNAF